MFIATQNLHFFFFSMCHVKCCNPNHHKTTPTNSNKTSPAKDRTASCAAVIQKETAAKTALQSKKAIQRDKPSQATSLS